MEEIWKDIIGYEGLYQISNYGKIKSLKKIQNGSNQYGCKFKIIKKEKNLKPNIDKNGYERITLYKNKKRKIYFIHRLVAEAFIPNPNDLLQINHKDENKLNNLIDNLEWCSAFYNINYGNRNKLVALKLKGKNKSKKHCLNISKAKKGKFSYLQKEAHKKQNMKIKYKDIIYESIRYASRKTGISRYLIKKEGEIL